jgi:hypothetical protein
MNGGGEVGPLLLALSLFGDAETGDVGTEATGKGLYVVPLLAAVLGNVKMEGVVG